MSSSNFLPKRTEFFAFLSAHTDRIVAGANAASRLVNGLGNPAGAAETATLIEEATSENRVMAALAVDACSRLNKAAIAMGDTKQNPEDIARLCHEIADAGTKAGQAMSEGVTRLFARDGDDDATIYALKMNRFYFAQYAVVNACKRAAQGIEEILLETA